MSDQLDIGKIRSRINKIVKDRDWDQFHTPKNLAMALAGEAGELLEIFQWLSAEESYQIMKDSKKATAVRHELADILIYTVRLADKLGVDLDSAAQEKISVSEAKYPVHLSKGTHKKYNELEE